MFLGVSLLIFILSIALYNPEKRSLKDNGATPFLKRIDKAKGTLLLGFLLVGLAMWSFNTATLTIQPEFAALFGLSQAGIYKAHFFFQFITSNFFHFDALHLLVNLSTLLLLSAYERRVGTGRFISIFLVSAISAAFLDLFFLSARAVTLGASGGLCGLATGYFLDYPNVTRPLWIGGLVGVLAVIFMTSVLPHNSGVGYNVNWLDHLLGAFCAAVFIRRFKPRPE